MDPLSSGSFDHQMDMHDASLQADNDDEPEPPREITLYVAVGVDASEDPAKEGEIHTGCMVGSIDANVNESTLLFTDLEWFIATLRPALYKYQLAGSFMDREDAWSELHEVINEKVRIKF